MNGPFNPEQCLHCHDFLGEHLTVHQLCAANYELVKEYERPCSICGIGTIKPSDMTCDYCGYGKVIANVTVTIEAQEIIDRLEARIRSLEWELRELQRGHPA